MGRFIWLAFCAFIAHVSLTSAYSSYYRTGSCNYDQFQCDNGKCTSRSYVCDGDFGDCDGSDEQFCKNGGGVRPGSFMCLSDRAIPLEYVCDGIDHCRDGRRSDEQNCPTVILNTNTTAQTSTTTPRYTEVTSDTASYPDATDYADPIDSTDSSDYAEATGYPDTTSYPETTGYPETMGYPETTLTTTDPLTTTDTTTTTQVPLIPVREYRGPIYVGSRVVRGPEWIFGEEDGGPSGEGVVKSISRGEHIVAWDCGTYGFYTASKAYLNPILHKAILEEGDEVVRGPGWDRSDQDGGEGNIGHVIEKSEIEMVKVKWSSTGEEDWYMGSSNDKHDLLLVRRNPVSGAPRQVTATPPSRLIRGYFTG